MLLTGKSSGRLSVVHTLSSFLFSLFFLQSTAWAEPPTHSRKAKSPRITESVSTVANCEEGYVISGNVITSTPDVKIVEEMQVGCDAAGQCKAYQVTALRKNGKVFDIEVAVNCTEDGEAEEQTAAEIETPEASEGAVQ